MVSTSFVNLFSWGAPQVPFSELSFVEDKALENLERKLKSREAEIRLLGENTKSRQTTWDREKQQLAKRIQELEQERYRALDCAQRWQQAHEAQIREHEKHSAEKEREFAGLMHQNLQKTELLDARSLELTAAQAFLSKADTVSEADALQLVNDLNAEIVQIAAILTDQLESLPTCAVRPEIAHEVKAFYGKAFTLGLIGRKPETIQVALQFALAHLFEWMSATWEFQATAATAYLENVYTAVYAAGKCRFQRSEFQRAKIIIAEEQPIAGRWRALTRKNIQGSGNLWERDELCQYLLGQIIPYIALLLSCAGLFSDPSVAYDYVTRKCGRKILAGIGLALRLNKALGCEITSGDLKLFFGEPNAPFNPISMEDEDGQGDDGEQSSGLIFGTTELGVTRKVKELHEGKLQVTERVLLQAKVVLESSLSIPDLEIVVHRNIEGRATGVCGKD